MQSMAAAPKPSKKGPPPIVKLDNALKLAERWVNSMTKSTEDKPADEPEGRPLKLGLGARVARQSNPMLAMSDDPIARKLHAKLNAGKRKASRNSEEPNQTAKNVCDDDEDSDEDTESRTNAFSKKRALPSNTKFPGNKKR